MRLSLDALAVLDAIDRRGSFAAAAEELHRVPSALSYTVQKLEDDLGVVVFDRRGHRAQLTEAGRALLEDGRQLLAQARGVEARARQIASGWEPELVVAVDDLIGVAPVIPVLCDFYALAAPTRLKLTLEVLGGCWDALLAGRADLAVGAPGDAPSAAGGAGYASRLLGETDFIFAVAPHHPLAAQPEPLRPEEVGLHRVVAVADTSRNLPPRSAGILGGQETLTVPHLQAKLAAQIAGLGIGHLPRHLAAPHLERGTLVEKRLAEPRPPSPLALAWRSRARGRALDWMIERFTELPLDGIVARPPTTPAVPPPRR